MDSQLRMPVTLDIDWDHAHQLYNQGVKFPKIAEIMGAKCNTIQAHAKRHNWAQRKIKATQAISEVVHSIVQDRPKTVQQRAEKWIDRTIHDIERTANVLESLPVPASLDGLRKHEEVWGMHVKRGRSTFGLDQAGTNIQVNIGMSGQLSSVEPVIDVEPEVGSIPTPPAS
jgi:Uncharacterized conserved protein